MTSSSAVKADNAALAAALREKINGKTKPTGALGVLEALALRIGLLQNTLTPELRHPHLVVFAGDHGAATSDAISKFPQDVTWQMVRNFLAGGAGYTVFARQNGFKAVVVDAGVKHDFENHPGMIHAKVAWGTRNYLHEPAMTPEECRQALATGQRIVHEIADRGCNVIGIGEKGIGNTSSASLITHFLTGEPLADCIGRGTGLDDGELAHKHKVLHQAAARCPHLTPGACAVEEVLTEFGGYEIVMMAGAYLAAAERQLLILADGFIATSALLAAVRLSPSVLDYCLFSHGSAERGHRLQLEALGCRQPLLDLGLRLGEATGAALALPLVQAAVNFLNHMASFEGAAVSTPSALVP